MSTPRFFPGLVVHHDIRNERYLLKDKLPKAAARGAATFTPKTKKHRQYRYYDQGQTPECTGFGSATLCASAHPFNAPPIDAHEWYVRNVAFDRAAGRWYSEGATVTAALEVGRQLGIFTEYRWAYEIRTMQEAILTAPLIAGTWWYNAMFDRNVDGVVNTPLPDDQPVGGHLFTINAYDAKRDLWRVPNSWGDGDYLIPGDLMHRLVREEGEIAQITEIKLPKLPKGRS